MAARTKSYLTPKYKTKYTVRNWPAYEAALRKRGDVTVWFDEAAADAWNAPSSGLPGGQRRYSDLALDPALPCIDAGAGECPNEPPTGQDGPICDLGHLGNTAQAHPRD